MKLITAIKDRRNRMVKKRRIDKFLDSPRVPWTAGYDDYKWQKIAQYINDPAILDIFRTTKNLPENYGVGLDERIVEYPFVFSRLQNKKTVFLDAGSTFNYEEIVIHPLLVEKEINVFTYYPENWNFVNRRISYQFGDLRQMIYRDAWFDEVICISTLEHIGMDNSLYGYDEVKNTGHDTGLESYQDAVKEMVRVLKPGGQLLMTFPFGVRKQYGFFQQFDSAMLQKILGFMNTQGEAQTFFFKYLKEGWVRSNEESCRSCESYNPHTGEGKGNDGAAHSRSICATHFIKAR